MQRLPIYCLLFKIDKLVILPSPKNPIAPKKLIIEAIRNKRAYPPSSIDHPPTLLAIIPAILTYRTINKESAVVYAASEPLPYA